MRQLAIGDLSVDRVEVVLGDQECVVLRADGLVDRHIRELAGSAMITLPSSLHDFENPEIVGDEIEAVPAVGEVARRGRDEAAAVVGRVARRIQLGSEEPLGVDRACQGAGFGRRGRQGWPKRVRHARG